MTHLQDIAQLWKCDDRLGMLWMVADVLFHPGHVVPAAKLVAATLKFANHAIAHMRVKIDAVVRQIIVVGAVGLFIST